MKRTDIKAGVVYAIKSSYGPPSPIVFLEDGAAGLYGRSNYGQGPIRKLEENKHTKAKAGRAGRGFSDSARGYAAINTSWSSKVSLADMIGQIRSASPDAELARFLAGKQPSVEGAGFEIVTSLGQIDGLYAEELAAYNARIEAEHAASRRKADEQTALAERIGTAVEGLSAYGIRAKGAWKSEQVELSADEAEKLVALLRAHAPTKRA